MAFPDVLQSLGKLIGLYPDEEPAQQEEYAYNEYGQPETDYEPAPADEDTAYQTGYGSGASYVRAGARPAKPAAARRPVEEPAPAQGLLGRIKQAQPRQAQYVPDNVIRMPERDARGAAAPARPSTQSSTIIFCVRRKDDCSQIINYLIDGVNVILNFEEVDDAQCQRVLDMVSGAAYALRASVERISHRNYLVAPTGVEIVRSETQGREGREAREDRDPREGRDRGGRDSLYSARY